MRTEIPQALLDEMILMDDAKFEYFEKKWHSNEQAKVEYEKQYYSQLQSHILYNKTFGENVCPMKPHDNHILLDTQLLAEARALNVERQITARDQQRNILQTDFSDTKSMTDRIFDGLLLNKLMEPAPEEPSRDQELEKEPPIKKDIEPELE